LPPTRVDIADIRRKYHAAAREQKVGNRRRTKKADKGRAASPRMTDASTEEEIDEPTGKFLRPCSDIASLPELGQLNIHRSSIGQI
jgi:hypothetical protein